MQVHDWTRTNLKSHPNTQLDKQWRSTKSPSLKSLAAVPRIVRKRAEEGFFSQHQLMHIMRRRVNVAPVKCVKTKLSDVCVS